MTRRNGREPGGNHAALLIQPQRQDLKNEETKTCGNEQLTITLPLNAAQHRTRPGPYNLGCRSAREKVPGAEVISAFNNIPTEALLGVFEARGKSDSAEHGELSICRFPKGFRGLM